MNIYSYIRWSSDPQTWGDSERRQAKAAQDYCARLGVELTTRTFKDRGQSARRGKHREGGALAELLSIAKEGDKILIEDNDRFSREDPITALVALREIVQRGITVVFLNDGTEVTKENFNNPAILFRNFFKGFVANNENERKAGMVGETWKQKRLNTAKGVILTEALPGWVMLDTEKKKLVAKEPQAGVVRRIFRSYANGKGIRTIMKELNAEKIPTFAKGEQNKGNGWSNTHLRRILCSRSVLGEYQPHKYISKRERRPDGDPVPNYYPVIVDKATFYKVQDLLSTHTHKSGCKKNATNLFTGTVKCAKCGSAMVIKRTGMKHGKYSYILLHCDKARRGGDCTKNKIQYPWIERAVLSVLWTKVLPVLSGNDERKQKLTACEGDLKHTRQRKEHLAKMLENPELVSATALKQLAELEAKEKSLVREIESLTARMTENPLLAWQQVPNTVENRLRLQTMLPEQVASLKVDAEQRRAWLTTKNPEHSFTLSWEKDGKEGFTLSGAMFAKSKFRYVDDVFVWKTERNVDVEKAVETFKAAAIAKAA